MTKQERAAWTVAYRLYEEFAPPLRQAATIDDDNELACKLFSSALDKLHNPCNESNEDGRLIILAAYDILGEVFKNAQKRHQERVQASACRNPHP